MLFCFVIYCKYTNKRLKYIKQCFNILQYWRKIGFSYGLYHMIYTGYAKYTSMSLLFYEKNVSLQRLVDKYLA